MHEVYFRCMIEFSHIVGKKMISRFYYQNIVRDEDTEQINHLVIVSYPIFFNLYCHYLYLLLV